MQFLQKHEKCKKNRNTKLILMLIRKLFRNYSLAIEMKRSDTNIHEYKPVYLILSMLEISKIVYCLSLLVLS